MTTPIRTLVVAAMLAAPVAHALSAPPPAAAAVAAPAGEGAAQLQSRYTQLRPTLERNAFGRAIHIESSEAGRNQAGEVYAVVDHPFEVVEKGLRDAQSWCDVLILPYNTKHCHASGSGAATRLAVRIGRKADQAPEDAQPISFRYALQAESADYFRVSLEAPEGPLSTRDYRIVLEATPLDAGHTFIHLGYSYGFGAMARLAMQAYLATAGAHKVGFTVVGRDSDGKPRYVGGMLGATERNTMRYFLAIDAYLGSLAAPEGQRLDKRINDWYAASLKYPRQLSELERGEYVTMKRRESARMKEAL
jgi:hypothetical protein